MDSGALPQRFLPARLKGQPVELARERIGEALQRLDDTIHEIRDHVFQSLDPSSGDEAAW